MFSNIFFFAKLNITFRDADNSTGRSAASVTSGGRKFMTTDAKIILEQKYHDDDTKWKEMKILQKLNCFFENEKFVGASKICRRLRRQPLLNYQKKQLIA